MRKQYATPKKISGDAYSPKLFQRDYTYGEKSRINELCDRVMDFKVGSVACTRQCAHFVYCDAGKQFVLCSGSPCRTVVITGATDAKESKP